MNTLAKPQLRRQLLTTREQLSLAEWQAKSDRIGDRLLALLPPDGDLTLLGYQSFRREPNLDYLFKFPRLRWGMPRCVDRDLVWHHWQPGDPLDCDRYGISTPLTSAPQLDLQAGDFMLIPCVGATPTGDRLGYGGGYYDRLLADDRSSQLTTIGITFNFALLKQLPTDPWDRPLDYIITESGIFTPD
jgi:5-formyltetrahydrofolate cyclo-ligase